MDVGKPDLKNWEQKTISECFDDALKTFEEISNCELPTNSSEVQYKVKKCMNLLEDVTRMVSSADIFSWNETIDEVSTSNVKLLLLPALLGTLTMKLTSKDRLEVTTTAEIYFRDFLQRCKNYGIKENLEIPPLETPEELMKRLEVGYSPRNVNMMAMARQRASKIQQYQEQKELESRMSSLKKQFDSPHVDEEIKRQYYMSYINCYINKALEDLDCLITEQNLLTRVNKKKPFGAPVWDDEMEKKLRRNCRSKPLEPILILRDELHKKVFGFGYPGLPLMTVKELYDLRMRDGSWVIPNLDNPTSLQEFSKSEVELLGKNEAEEIATEKCIEEDDPEFRERTRNMDEYKDTHSRGWGNRYNRS